MRGEHFLTARSGVQCSVKVQGLPELSAWGSVFLTHLRIVFTAKKPVALGDGQFFEAFDFPLNTLAQEQFHQPIFGANYLSGVVQPIAGMGLPGPAEFRITFKEGGCGTFLYCFMRALREARVASRAAASGAARPSISAAVPSAFVDPSDPSVIFVVQPDVPLSSVSPDVYGANVPVAVAVPVVEAVPVAGGPRGGSTVL